jgi:tetratricopeptide (TPR) repeat protein
VPAFSSAYFDLEGQWIKTFNDGVTALDSNLYGKAEPLLKEAVSLSERFGAGDPRYPKSLGELGRLYTIRRRYAEAEPLLEQQLHFTEVQLGKNTGKTIPALGQLIKFYMLYGTASKADPLAEELLGFIDGKLREDAEMNGEQPTQGKGKVLTAWAGTAPPATHIPRMDWAVTCDRLGDLYRFRKKFDMAERFYKAGLDIKVTIMGKEHMSMAVSYDNLGMLALDKEEYKDAEDYFRESLETTQKIMGNGDPDTYARLDRLAKALIKEKKFDEAEKTYYRALEIWKSEPNAAGAKARCLYQLGSMQCDIGRFGSAAGLLSQALNLSVKANGSLSYYNVPYMRKLAYALYYCGRRGESDGLKARANYLAEGMEEPTPEKTAEKTADKSDVKTATKPSEKTAEKTAEKASDKAAEKVVGKPGDKASAVAKGEAGKAGKSAVGDKGAKVSSTYDPDKTFIKPGTATAAETIRTMREQGKAGPMKPVPEDEDEKPMNLMKMMREADARKASEAAPPQPSTPPPAVSPAVQPAVSQPAVSQPAVSPPGGISTPSSAPVVDSQPQIPSPGSIEPPSPGAVEQPPRAAEPPAAVAEPSTGGRAPLPGQAETPAQ